MVKRSNSAWTVKETGKIAENKGAMKISTICKTCKGRGKISTHDCVVCHGDGKVLNKRNIQTRIPAGIQDGEVIRLRGEGETGENGGAPGDLILTINVQPDHRFTWDGKQLIFES